MYNSEEDNRFKTILEFKELSFGVVNPYSSGTEMNTVCALQTLGIASRRQMELAKKYAAHPTMFSYIRSTVIT